MLLIAPAFALGLMLAGCAADTKIVKGEDSEGWTFSAYPLRSAFVTHHDTEGGDTILKSRGKTGG
jgi:hypothetical protein